MFRVKASGFSASPFDDQELTGRSVKARPMLGNLLIDVSCCSETASFDKERMPSPMALLESEHLVRLVRLLQPYDFFRREFHAERFHRVFQVMQL